tara:strand:- start:1286 stop:3730 length:2445 start_codon:yes stop_codon:yes gene_type:complete
MARRENRAATQFSKLRQEMEALSAAIQELIANQRQANAEARAEYERKERAEAAAETRRTEADRRQSEAAQKRLEAERRSRAAAEKELEQAEKRVGLLKDEFNAASGKQKKLEKLLEIQEEQLDLEQKTLKTLEEGSNEYADQLEKIEEIKKGIKTTQKTTEKLGKNLEENKQSMEMLADFAKDFSSSLGSLAKGDFVNGFKKLGGTLVAPLKKLAGRGLKKRTDKLLEGISGLGTKLPDLAAGGQAAAGATTGMSTSMAAAGVAAVGLGVALAALIAVLVIVAVAIGAAMILAKFTLEIENSSRELTKITGLSKSFAHSMHENAMELRTAGVSAEDLNGALTSLNATFTDFSMLSVSTAKKVADTTAMLTKLGMSTDDASRGFQVLTKGMAQTPEQAADTMIAMDALARDLNVSTSKIGADFAGAASHLQKLTGPEALRSFKQLSVISKATGIEVSRLLAITEKFDTFEGAATQAGKLNAALGGNFVNAMELMTATNPAERFEMIRDSILDSGLAFDQMSYYQKKFFADAAGLADVGELALAMSGDFGAVNSEIGKTQADYEAAAERAKSFQSVQEQLKNSFYQLLPVITPLVEKIDEFTSQFTEFVKENKEPMHDMFSSLGEVMISLADTFITLTPIITPLLKLFIYLVEIFIKYGNALGVIAQANIALKKTMTVRQSPSLLDAVAMLGEGFSNIGKGIDTVFSPVQKLVTQMRKLKQFFGDDVTANVVMKAAGVTGVGDGSANAAATMRATAPTIANNTAIRNSASSTTINNSSQGGSDTGISIKFDNKKFADLFDVQVEKSIGRTARKAVI